MRHVADVARAAVAVAAPEHAASFAGLLAWTAGTAGPMTSLAELVRHISRGERGFYISGPVQELLLTILLGEAEAAALARRLDGLRPMPAGPSQPPAPPAQALAEPPAAPPAPSARPRLLLTWGNVTPTGADAPSGGRHCHPTARTGVLADPVRSDYTIVGPPQLPLQDATYSCIYVPLLLDAGGILALPARRQWREHPVFAPWWGVTVDALLSRPFLPVHQVLAGINNIARAHSPSSQAALARVREWAALRGPGQVTSLAVFVREVGQQAHGYYLCGPLQEVLLVLLLGANAAATIAHRLDALRAPLSPENDQPAHALPGVDPRDAGDPPEQPPHAGPTAPDTGEVPHEQVPRAENHGAAAEAQPVPHTAQPA